MTSARAFLVRAIIVTTAILAASPGFAHAADDAPDLAQFEAQRRERLASFEFACDYDYKTAVFDSLEDANKHAGSQQRKLDDVPISASGFVAKRGENYRFSAAHDFHKQGDYVLSTGVDCDRALNNVLDAAFFPPIPDQDGAESLGVLKPTARGDVLAVLPELALESPLALETRPLDSLPAQYGAVKLSLHEAEKVGDDQARFTFVGDSPRGKCVKSVLIRIISSSKSAVQKIETKFYNASGTKVVDAVLETAEDWIDVQGVPAPARIRRVTANNKGPDGRYRYFVAEWSTRNLGKRRPNKFDFIINIKDGKDVDDPVNDPENGIVDLASATAKDVARESIVFRNGQRASK